MTTSPEAAAPTSGGRPPKPGSRRRLHAAGAATLLVVALLHAARHGDPAGDPLPARGRASGTESTAWPVIESPDDATPRSLPVHGFVERGAIRIETRRASADLELHLVSLARGAPRLTRHAPDYANGRLSEYYGLVAGVRRGFVRAGDEVSGLLEITVPRGGIVAVRLPDLAPRKVRHLKLRQGELPHPGPASVLADFGGLDVLLPWHGAPIELGSPLSSPTSLTVRRTDAGGTGPVLGRTFSAVPEAGDITLDLGSGTGSLHATVLGDEEGAPEDHTFRLGLTAPGDFLTKKSETRLLACVREDEFQAPPRIHTWDETHEPAGDLDITGLTDGRYRVAVGLRRQASYTLWRALACGAAERDEIRIGSLPEAPAAGEGDRHRLPLWMRSLPELGPTHSDATRSQRSVHPAGPFEVWREADTPGLRFELHDGFGDATGRRHELTRRPLHVPLPDGMEKEDVARLRVEVFFPWVEPRLGRIYECEVTDPSRLDGLPPAPDGRIACAVRDRAGAERLGRGYIRDGAIVAPGSLWSEPSPDDREVVVRVRDGDGRPLAGAFAYPASGERIGPSGDDGEITVRLARGSSKPALLRIAYDDDRFNGRLFADGDEHEVAVGGEETVPWRWRDFAGAIGFDPEGLGCTSLFVLRHPFGEVAIAKHDESHALHLPAADLVEVQGQGRGAVMWSWVDLADQAERDDADGRAAVVIVNRRRARVLHLTLPRAEVKVTLQPGEVRELTVRAPSALYALSVIEDGKERKRGIEEGMGAVVRPDDVMVLEYD